MSLTVKDSRTYSYTVDEVFQAALGAIAGLEGKMVQENANDGRVEARFDKKILGKVLGDRTHLQVDVSASAPGETAVAVEVYPLNAVGQKLMFGARKGVSATVANWFFAHLEHRLKT